MNNLTLIAITILCTKWILWIKRNFIQMSSLFYKWNIVWNYSNLYFKHGVIFYNNVYKYVALNVRQLGELL